MAFAPTTQEGKLPLCHKYTRIQLNIDIPGQNLESSTRIFSYSGAKTWNEIPFHIKMSPHEGIPS